MRNSVLKFITRASVVAAAYFVASAVCSPIAFGPLQFRLSEALVLLAALMPEAIPGLTIGCILSNFAFSPYSLYDMLFGGLATFLGAVGTYFLRKKLPLSAIPPIIFNAFLVPVIWIIDGTDKIYIINALEILASEVVTVGVLGIPLAYALKKTFEKSGIILANGNKKDFEKDVEIDERNCEKDDDGENAFENDARDDINEK